MKNIYASGGCFFNWAREMDLADEMATKELLLHPKNAAVLVSLKEDGKKWYASSLARQSGLSYVYVTEVLGVFHKEGLIEIRKEGKIKRVVLTESGLKVANALDELVSRLNAIAAAPAPKEEKKAEAAPAVKAEEKKA